MLGHVTYLQDNEHLSDQLVDTSPWSHWLDTAL